jgi:hypothetical protein
MAHIPLGRGDASFGILSFGKTLKLFILRLTRRGTMSRSSDASLPIVKGVRRQKMCSSCPYPALVAQPESAQGHNTSKTLHSRCQSASRTGFDACRNSRKWSAGTFPVFTTALVGDGGDRRDRTDDLKLAKLPLYQLSYVPGSRSSQAKRASPTSHTKMMVGLGRLELPTSRLSSARSNQLSYRPENRANALLCDQERET